MPNKNAELNSRQNGCGRAVKNAIAADVNRIYDSCADRDCLEDLEVVFPEAASLLLETACSVKARSADILTAYTSMDEVSYNRGCYAVECEYYFWVNCDIYQPDSNVPESVQGVCTFTKRSMLYGGTGSVNTFSSLDTSELPSSVTQPVAKVQAMTPIVLGSELLNDTARTCVQIPEAVNRALGGDLVQNDGEKTFYVTLGLFSIMQLSRDVQVNLPAYEFAIPEKECNVDSESPCDVFRTFDFPLDEFFPQGGGKCNPCGCDVPVDYDGECPNQNRRNR